MCREILYFFICHRYLEESLIGLDSSAEITQKHLPGILQSLNEELAKTLDWLLKEIPSSNETKKRIRSLKKLQMASKGMFHHRE